MKKGLGIVFFIIYFVSSCFSQSRSLDDYLGQALANSPLLKDYQNQLRANTYDSLLIHANFLPQVTSTGQILVSPTHKGWGYDEAITNGGNYSAVVGASQNILNTKLTKLQYQKVNLQGLSIGNSKKISEQDVKKSVTSQYVTVYIDFEELAFTRSVLGLLNEQKNLLKAMVENGIYKQTDYLTFTIQIQAQEVAVKQSEIAYRNDLLTLNYLCGINDTAGCTLTYPDLQINSPSSPEASVFFGQFRLDSLKIINEKSLLDQDYRPKLSWFADAGLNAVKLNNMYQKFGTSFGLNFSMPIFDWHQRNINYRKFQISEDSRQNYRSFYLNQYRQQLSQIRFQINSSQQLVQSINEQLKSSEQLISLNKKLLDTGNISVNDFILAIKNYIEIKNTLVKEQLNQLLLINELNYWSL